MFDESDDSLRRDNAENSGEERETTMPAAAAAEGMQNASSRTRYRFRYGDAAMSWLALGTLLAAWHMEARVDRPAPMNGRLAAVRESSRLANELWLSGVTRARSWITRAATTSVEMTGSALTPAGAAVGQPDWSAIASVRTAKRWLGAREK
jgi:hypothetical protein